jgi:transcriptional regulator with XRE-family HTH domain
MRIMARQHKQVDPDPSNPWPERLLEARLRLGLTQPEAAARIGVSARAWIGWERGQHRPLKHFVPLLEKLIKSKK